MRLPLRVALALAALAAAVGMSACSDLGAGGLRLDPGLGARPEGRERDRGHQEPETMGGQDHGRRR